MLRKIKELYRTICTSDALAGPTDAKFDLSRTNNQYAQKSSIYQHVGRTYNFRREQDIHSKLIYSTVTRIVNSDTHLIKITPSAKLISIWTISLIEDPTTGDVSVEMIDDMAGVLVDANEVLEAASIAFCLSLKGTYDETLQKLQTTITHKIRQVSQSSTPGEIAPLWDWIAIGLTKVVSDCTFNYKVGIDNGKRVWKREVK